MATKTCFQPPHGRSATNPDSASASGARRKTALAALGTTRRSPDPVSPFRGFSARTSNTPTPHHPTAPIPEGDPSNDGPGNDDDNPPEDDDPSNDPDDNGPSDNDPEDDLDFPDPDTEPTITVLDNLASAIKLLAHNARTTPESSSRTKLREPDTFDGTDPKKLCTFFIQCELNFQDRPRAFRTDHAKVIFAQLYLKGMALEWFEPDLLGLDDPNDRPLCMDSWREFILELQTTFGPHDPVADAESQLDHLYMKDNQRINKYVDEVCQVGKPQTLHELRHLAQEIDARYWEHKEEVQQASKHQGSSNSSNNKSGGSSSNSQPKSGQEKAKTGSNNNSSSSPKLASSKLGNNNNSNSSKPEPSKLGKDGKLTPEERKHRIDGNLCMFCRGSGHFADKCPKKARKAKARAAATTEAASALGLGTTPETKK
ncbi:hypothetical protein M404DRAFT_152594 [Pisolithus tinctorius Marx 270]|uniref:Retrotransposon gag domain-containing protein n=1 Tax=Pisolithus tinctorius Marx 270 TaxID=870435 RepID=A0A0C3JST7_PISTI|nr:hypothetical protein M404DRAFT_152594 [Pisolithus tinctorius Marx 270]